VYAALRFIQAKSVTLSCVLCSLFDHCLFWHVIPQYIYSAALLLRNNHWPRVQDNSASLGPNSVCKSTRLYDLIALIWCCQVANPPPPTSLLNYSILLWRISFKPAVTIIMAKITQHPPAS